MQKTSQFAATKMEKLALPASAEAWEGSGTLCLKTPSTGAASQRSRGFRACKQPWVHQETTNLGHFFWTESCRCRGWGQQGGWPSTVPSSGATCSQLPVLAAWAVPPQSDETSEPRQGYFRPGFAQGMYF